MDFSENYINMCIGACEIQSRWIREHGDIFIGENGRVEFWVAEIHQKRPMKKNFAIQTAGKVIFLSRYIWLPRLNQLMELAQTPHAHFEKTTQMFFDWTKTDYGRFLQPPPKIFASLEQSWLAFIMQKKFAKIWDGQCWLKNGF